ncbi:MAG: helix-turn-helix transcriptional regulator [Cyclobacteriaceae bacterium]
MSSIICNNIYTMASENVQSSFLEQVKKRLAPNLSFADEVAEALKISRDSAYRRIRGETVLSLDEAKVLCNQYGVSLDILLGTSSEIVPFRHQVVNDTPETFEKWLRSVLSNLETIQSFPAEKEIVFCAKDVPPFHYFEYTELTAFKMFFWMKSVLNYQGLQSEKFKPQLVSGEYITLGKKIWEAYNKIPSIELWSDETTNVTLRQIEFYHESGFFNSPSDGLLLLDQYANMLQKIREKSANGYKTDRVPFKFYKNEILIADNNVLFRMGEKKVAYVIHNITEILMTTNEAFCKQTEYFVNNLQNRSILISTTGEKERNKFFNRMEEKIEAVKKRISS